MMYVTLFFTVCLAVYAGFEARAERRKRLARRLALLDPDAASLMEEEAAAAESRPKPMLKLLAFLWKEGKRAFGRRTGDDREKRIERKLLRAGSPFNMNPADFRMLQLSASVLLPALFAGYALLLRLGTGGAVLLAIIGLAGGMLLPNLYLKMKAGQRLKMGLRDLPDVLDLLTVSLEAGLGFDAALSKLVSRKEGVLAAEFRRCLEEIRLGKTRRESLEGVRERLPVDEIKSLIGSILQAEKLGIGMVQVMRVQSQEVREQRKQRAEEAAMKAPIKMLFPLVLFIFPTLFIVLLGPAVIQFIETFSKN
jgi:tight adherence protein C